VRLVGINWFGLETCSFAPHGLWTRNWRSMMVQIKDLGFNTIRLPYSSQLFDPGSIPNGIDYTLNPDLKGLTGLQIMDKIVAEARVLGLMVILDRHRPDCGAQSPLWYTNQYSETRWISDWVMLAKRYADNPAVIGADLDNEPHTQATWGDGNLTTDWRLAAERAGNAILRVNPNWLIIVEGIEHVGPTDYYWWGGNLAAAGSAPVQLRVAHHLVYSAHDYGPEVYNQSWFTASTFPQDLPSVWDRHWGYLVEQGIAPVFVGEFGGQNVSSGPEGLWIQALLTYMRNHGMSYAFWCMNPDSGDTGGLLEDNWQTVNAAKLALLQPDLASSGAPLPAPSHTAVPAPPPSGSMGSAPPTTTADLIVKYFNGKPDPVSNNPSPNIEIVNNGSVPVALDELEARYYFTATGLGGQSQILDVDWASVGAGNVLGDFVHVDGDQYYLRIRFSPAAGQLSPHGGMAEIKMRIHKPDWSVYDQRDAYSFGPPLTYTPWSRIPLFDASRLVWGAPEKP
jgi:endoglucanase